MKHFVPQLSGSTVISGSLTISTDIVPSDTNVYDIGSASMGWRNIYGTASQASSASYVNVANLGIGIVSSSNQVINHLPDGTISGSTQVNFTEITNTNGIVSSSTQIQNSLPSDTISSSAQIASDISGAFNGVTSSFITNADTASFITNAETSSFITNADTSSFLTNDIGVISSSAQLNNLSFTSSVSLTADSASVIANVTESGAPHIRMWVGTSASYASISTKDDNTLYFLT